MFTQPPTPRQTNAISPAVRAEILRSLIPVAVHMVVAQLDAFAARLANAMLAASESIADPREAHLTFNSGQLLKNNGYVFYYCASAGIEAALRKEMQVLQTTDKKAVSDTSLQDVALTLVSYEEMDRKLAMSRSSRSLELANAEQLAALNMRLGTLLDAECLSITHNPFRPEVFLTSLHASWCEFDPDTNTHPLVLPLLRSDIVFDLSPILQAVNDTLIKHGILPDLQESYRIKKINPKSRQYGNQVPTKEAVAQKLREIFSGRSGAQDPWQNGGVDEAGRYGGGASAAPAFGYGGGNGESTEAIHGSFPPLFDQGEAGSLAGRIGQPGSTERAHAGRHNGGQDNTQRAITSGPLFSYLADMQKEMALRKLVEGAQDMIRLSQVRDKMDTLAHNPVERNTLDLLAKIFDTVFTNQSIPNPIKELISVLQVPVLKAALLDKDFFFQEAHPARRLIELLTEYSLAWDQSKGAADPLFQTMQRNVNRVQHEYDEKIALFEEVVSDLEGFVAQEEESSKEALQAPIKRALQKEKIKQANVAATHEVAMRVGTGEVVAFVETFLESRWTKVLTIAYSVKEEKPRVIEDAIRTMDDLIWSVKPKITLDQRQELLQRLPAILSRLNKWLSVIKWDDEDRLQFFADLAECHASIVRAPLNMSPELQLEMAVEVAQKAAERRLEKKTQVAAAEPVLLADIHVDTVASLERGIWLELTWQSDMTSRVRLAWVSPMRSLYIFTTNKKEQSFSLATEELEQSFRDGRAQILVVDKLVDRALMDALQPAVNVVEADAM